jgi:hypothetical protein
MYVFSAVGYVNTITAVVIGILYLKEPYRRKYPRTIPIIMMFVAWSFTFAASWSLMKGSDVNDWNCEDAVTPIDGRTARCAAQGRPGGVLLVYIRQKTAKCIQPTSAAQLLRMARLCAHFMCFCRATW